ncbi:hypothetical protein Vafri_932 [Volvox africanus]|nr:hypothetical protein Vafri_932 [Volvox africanus]
MPGSTNRSQSGHSVSSFSSAPSRESVVSRLEDGARSELMELGEGVVVGIFGVLFTIVKERYNTGVRFLLAKLAFDFFQLLTVVFTPGDGWAINQDLWLWKAIQVLQVEDVMRPRGYIIFLITLYTMIALLGVAVVLAVWVAWCFQHRNFPFVWPIKILRVYANIFFHILDVATLTLLQLPFDCRWLGYPKELRNLFALFPGKVCTHMPHVAHMASAGVALAVYLAMALLNLMADFELNPTTRNLYATSNSDVEIRAFCIKFLMTVVSYGVGWRKAKVILQFVLATYLTWLYLKWQPHLFGWVNHLRVGLNASIATVALGGIILVFHGKDNAIFRERITTIFLSMIGAAMAVGAIVSYVWLSWWTMYVLMRYRTAPPGQKARRIYKFKDSREVEIVARVCRKWTDQHYEVLDRAAAKEAEIVIKGGMQLFPGDAFMIITYVNLLIDVLESTQTGYSQLQAAKKCTPNLMERFAIFAREQEHMQRATGAKSGESSVDLVSYVEYQRNHRMVMRAHRSALVAIRNFWQLLLHNTVAFTSLAKALHRIEKSVNVAEGFYRAALARYPSSPKLLRGYGKFLEAVKNNPWKASKYFSEAEKLQDMQQQDEATMAVMGPEEGSIGSNGTYLLHRVDERVNIVFLINSAGIIQLANKNACSLLGYGKGELDGKNINIIMPPPFSQRHNRYIRQYIQTGRERVISSVNTVVALHKARYVLPVKLAVSKVSGATEDSIFMGVLETVPVDPAEAHLYMLPNGVVTAMDQAFAEWMGFELADIIGKDVATLVTEPESLKRILPKFDACAMARAEAMAAAGAGATAAGATPGSPAVGKFGTMGLGLGMGMGLGHHTSVGAAPIVTPAIELALAHLVETLPSVQFLHKYTRPVDCNVSLKRLGIGPVECMVEMTLRRNGPAHLLALTGPSGRVRYIASELARALGTSPSALYRQPLGDIMPQPWGTLHAAWIKSMGGQSAIAAAAIGAIVPGSCRSGITTVLGSSLRMQGYYRLAISSNEDAGEMRHVVEAEPSTREEALSERRLVLTVDADGIVTEVDDGPTWLYGFSPKQLLGRSLADVVTTLRPARGAGANGSGGCPEGIDGGAVNNPEEEEVCEDVPVTELLSLLITKAMMQNGVSWRVGVTVPTDEAELQALGVMRQAVMAKRTTPAIMEIEVSLDTTALGRAVSASVESTSSAQVGRTSFAAGGSMGSGSAAVAAATAATAVTPAPAVAGASARTSITGGAPPTPVATAPSARLSIAGGLASQSSGTQLADGGESSWRTARMSSSSGVPQSPAKTGVGTGASTENAVPAVPNRHSAEGIPSPTRRPSVPRLRRKSWIAVESPRGGIRVVSGAAMEGVASSGTRPNMRAFNTRHSINSTSSYTNWAATVNGSVGGVETDGASVHFHSPTLMSDIDPAEGLAERSPLDSLDRQVTPRQGSRSTPVFEACASIGKVAGYSQQPPPLELLASASPRGCGDKPKLPVSPRCPPEPPRLPSWGDRDGVVAAAADGGVGTGNRSCKGHDAVCESAGFGSILGSCVGRVGGTSGPGGGEEGLGATEADGNDNDGAAVSPSLRGSIFEGGRGQGSGRWSGPVGEGVETIDELLGELLPGGPVGDHPEAVVLDGADGEIIAWEGMTSPRSLTTAELAPTPPLPLPLPLPLSLSLPLPLLGRPQQLRVPLQLRGRSQSHSQVVLESRQWESEQAAAAAGAEKRRSDSISNTTLLLKQLLSARVSHSAANGPHDVGLGSRRENLLAPLLPLLVGDNFNDRRSLVPSMVVPPTEECKASGGASGGGATDAGGCGSLAEGDDASVELPPSVADDARVVVIRVSLWRADLLTPVLEVDANGCIAAMVGDDLAPPGLLFGVPTSAMMYRSLYSFLQLQDRSVAGLFHDPGTAKRGGLKTTAKEANKIGTLREVTGRHSDGEPLELTLQAVVKESTPSRTYVVLKPRKPSKGSRATLLHSISGLAHARTPTDDEMAQQRQMQMQMQMPVRTEPHDTDHSGALSFQDMVGVVAAATDATADDATLSAGYSILPTAGSWMGPVLSVRNQALLRYSFDSGGSPDRSRSRTVVPPVLEKDGDGVWRSIEVAAGHSQRFTTGRVSAKATALPVGGEEHPFGVGSALATRQSPVLTRLGSTGAIGLSARMPMDGGEELKPSPLSPRVQMIGPATPLLPFRSGSVGGDSASPGVQDQRKSLTGVSEMTRSSIASAVTSVSDSGSGSRKGAAGARRSSSTSRAIDTRDPRAGASTSAYVGSARSPPRRSKSPPHKYRMPSRRLSEKLLGKARQSSGDTDETRGSGQQHEHPPPQQQISQGTSSLADGDADDNASEVSGGSGVSEVLDASTPTADYRRGKRYRKLLKVLESPVVQRAARDFQWQALLANVAQLVTNLLAFILLTVLLQRQARQVETLRSATSVSRLMHESLIIMQKLNNHYEKIYPSAKYYTADSILNLSNDLKVHLDKFASLVTEIYSDIGNRQHEYPHPYDPDNPQYVWNMKLHNETLFYTTTPYRIEYRNASLWDMSSSFIERASEVQHMHSSWGSNHSTLSDFDAYRWSMTNGLGPLYNGYSDALLQLTHAAIDAANKVNQLQLVLLVLQGCVVCVLLLIYMWWLQRRVSQQRYCLYSLFMLVPVGLLRALASKSVAVNDNSDAEASSDDEHADQMAMDAGARPVPSFNLLAKNNIRNGAQGGSSAGPGALSRLFSWASRGSGSNRGLPKPPIPGTDSRGSSHHGHNGSGSSTSSHKRRNLVPSNHDSVSLLAPFVVWGVLICVLYAVGFLLLQNAQGPLALLSTHNIAVVRMHRLILYSLQVNSQTSDESKVMMQPILDHELRAFTTEWDVVLYGANDTLRQERRFRLCDLSAAFSNKVMSDETFRLYGCLSTSLGDVKVHCPVDNDTFYAATVHGVNMMVERFKEDIAYLIRIPISELSINNTHLDYIMLEENIEIGVNAVSESLITNIHGLYKEVSFLQIFSLVLSWLLAVAFIFMQLRPFVRANRVETQRIARMLSELPPEVDIEAIVARVLLRDGMGGGGGGGGGGSVGSGGGNGGQGPAQHPSNTLAGGGGGGGVP